MNALSQRILQRAHELGFVRAGIVPAEPLPHGDAFRDWISTGQHGEMAWLAKSADIRDHPQKLLKSARSIIALAASYHIPDEQTGLGTVAMYARGYDYHKVLEHRLQQLAAFIRAEAGQEVHTRECVDRLPLLERDVAYLAGLGWYGKNTMIMDRQYGSFLFLAELIVDLDLESSGRPVKPFCGSCTQCIDDCPTQAITAPHQLDARRCVAYLTIEHRGPIPRELRRGVGLHLFGCDICQTVCPWNRKAPYTSEFAFLGRPSSLSLSAPDLLTLEEPAFRALLALSPIQRARRSGLLRNAAVVLGNSGDRLWVPLLTSRLNLEREALIRGHVAWALGELGGADARLALSQRQRQETDPYVLEEIRAALGG